MTSKFGSIRTITSYTKKIEEAKSIVCFMPVSDPLNKASKKLKNSYHIKFIDNLEEVVIRVKGYIDMKMPNTLTKPYILIAKPKKKLKRKEGKREKEVTSTVELTSLNPGRGERHIGEDEPFPHGRRNHV